MCEVSVIVAVKNGEKFMERTLDSILSQTFRDFEVIIVDDGSTDQTLQIAERYSNEYEKVQLLNNPGPHGNAGAYAKSYGVMNARGNWIAICDADDLWSEDKLQRQIDFRNNWSHREPLAIIGTAGYIVNEKDRIMADLDANPKTYSEFKSLRKNYQPIVLHHSSVLFDKQLFIKVGGYTDTYTGAEDTELWTRMADHGVALSLADQLFSYRKHLDSFQLANTEKQMVNFMRIAENARRRHKGILELNYEDFVNQIFCKEMSLYEQKAFKRRLRGKYYYRMGATCAANNHYILGALYLSRAMLYDPSIVTSGVKRAIFR
ncbi:glycosyltransferase family 2 protein [Alicyclobacillus ferrooxydans]|uniref:Glycosyltransferase 2-like domain-containing protein n=1 Tax=Alicyclobacillus ferrooxydans TaxID=471514 RepID=A0A0P9CRL9_9BACL|nr:glycosyltransferase family 2 protein [Alicyclobacillus ferrooxydans]KPV39307.1 hypothetical protein AN477_22680 [Alicyclobacillus ferrooxydans]